MEGLINFEILKKWLGYERKHDVKEWLKNKGIPFEVGRNDEPITTAEAINRRLIGGDSNDEIDFEM